MRLSEPALTEETVAELEDVYLDLLFVNGNHFELLEFHGYENNIPEQGVYRLDSSWSQKYNAI